MKTAREQAEEYARMESVDELEERILEDRREQHNETCQKCADAVQSVAGIYIEARMARVVKTISVNECLKLRT